MFERGRLNDSSSNPLRRVFDKSKLKAVKRRAARHRRAQEILDGLREAIEEIMEARRTGRQLPDLREWLDRGGLDEP